MTETPQYDCLTCGSCCHSQSPGQGYVLLSERDQERLRPFSLPILSSPVQDSDPPEIVQMLGTRLDANGCKVCAAFTGVAGGVNACFADGSVKFLKDSTNINVIWAIGSRAQNEAVSADQF